MENLISGVIAHRGHCTNNCASLYFFGALLPRLRLVGLEKRLIL